MTAETTPRCTAHKKNGEPCKRSPIKGATVCRPHGGAAPQVRRAAALRVAQEKALTLAQRMVTFTPDSDPLQVLLEQVWRSHAMVRAYAAMADRLGDDLVRDTVFGPALDVRVKLYQEATERAAKISKLALDAGVQERQVRMSEQMGSQLFDLIAAACDAMKVTAEQRTVGLAAIEHKLAA